MAAENPCSTVLWRWPNCRQASANNLMTTLISNAPKTQLRKSFLDYTKKITNVNKKKTLKKDSSHTLSNKLRRAWCANKCRSGAYLRRRMMLDLCDIARNTVLLQLRLLLLHNNSNFRRFCHKFWLLNPSSTLSFRQQKHFKPITRPASKS